MCGRATLSKKAPEVEKRFMATFYSDDLLRYHPLPSFNVAPGHFHPLLTRAEAEHIQVFRWGLIPFWAKDKKIAAKLINARAETLSEKNAFKYALEQRRCIVPFDGFYEWKKINKTKQPYRIVRNDKNIFSVAGLWESWKGDNNKVINSFTIITVSANSLVKKLHDRMPAILFEDEERFWIDKEISHIEAKRLLKPFPSELIFAYPVSTKINNVRNNSPDLIIEVPENNYLQGNLF